MAEPRDAETEPAAAECHDRPDTDGGDRPDAGDCDRPEADDAGARRYLDLWERNLAHLALRGPSPVRARR